MKRPQLGDNNGLAASNFNSVGRDVRDDPPPVPPVQVQGASRSFDPKGHQKGSTPSPPTTRAQDDANKAADDYRKSKAEAEAQKTADMIRQAKDAANATSDAEKAEKAAESRTSFDAREIGLTGDPKGSDESSKAPQKQEKAEQSDLQRAIEAHRKNSRDSDGKGDFGLGD